jgi:hypothetical protein
MTAKPHSTIRQRKKGTEKMGESKVANCTVRALHSVPYLPNASKLLLIEIPSFSRPPIAFVFFIRSLPAKSTKWNLDDVTVPVPMAPVMGSGLGAGVVMSREKVQIAWEREEVAFIAVVPVTLALVATSSSLQGEGRGGGV